MTLEYKSLLLHLNALDIARMTLMCRDLDKDTRDELERIAAYLVNPCLPLGQCYVFPCMDPRYCEQCASLFCSCPENDVPGMPGSFT